MREGSGAQDAGLQKGYARGFWGLLFTELWERFSYFGNRAILVLFLVSPPSRGGFGLDDVSATAIYGLYASGTYLAGLPGGWLGDRLLGAQRAVLSGGTLILLASIALTIVVTPTAFFLSLAVAATGIGLLKPNVSTLVAALHARDPSRLDSAFTLYYMGICVGAGLAGLVAPIAAATWGWRAGYVSTAAGMALGLTVFAMTRRHLPPQRAPTPTPRSIGAASVVSLMLVVLAALLAGGWLQADAVLLTRVATGLIVAMAGSFFVWVLGFERLGRCERGRVLLIAVLCLACALYWSGAELAGSALTLFAERHTLREVAALSVFGVRIVPAFEFPAGAFQAVNPVLIIALAPLFSMLWTHLARCGKNIPSTLKFALGLLTLGLGFFVMTIAAGLVADGGRVGPSWLLMTYAFHTVGELCLSPVGLAAISRLAPQRFAGQMMGAWFLSVALGTLISAQLAAALSPGASGQAVERYLLLGLLACGAAAGLCMLNALSRRLPDATPGSAMRPVAREPSSGVLP